MGKPGQGIPELRYGELYENQDGTWRYEGMTKVYRQDMAAFLKRLADLAGKSGGVTPRTDFTDVNAIGHIAEDSPIRGIRLPRPRVSDVALCRFTAKERGHVLPHNRSHAAECTIGVSGCHPILRKPHHIVVYTNTYIYSYLNNMNTRLNTSWLHARTAWIAQYNTKLDYTRPSPPARGRRKSGRRCH